MRRTFGFALALSILPACAPVTSAELADESIINGTRVSGTYPSVVAVYWQEGTTAGGLCTGTVIGPYAILTAKHCVFNENADGTHTLVPADNFYVLQTDDIDSGTIDIGDINRVYEIRTTAGSNIDFDVSNGTDIAVLILREAIDADVIPIARSGPAIGEDAIAVGFGRTSVTDTMSAGVKYEGLMRVSMVGMRQILAGSRGTGGGWTCQGDSGGPLFDEAGNVAGVTSYGFDRSCRVDDSVFVRVAGHLPLIDAALLVVPPCTPSSESCNGLDDDCDGTPDDGIGCIPVGSPCTMTSECLASRCEDVAGAMRCVTSCLPDSPVPCPSGTYCDVTGCGGGRCIPGVTGAGANGAVCTVDTECASGNCVELASGRFCGAACCPEFGVYCPSEADVCATVVGGMLGGACVPPELAVGPRPFGAPCEEAADCESMDCADPGGFCTRPCDTAAMIYCPDGYHCGETTCVRGGLSPQGGPCSTAIDCTPGLVCVEAMCATPCDPAAAECPLGTACETDPVEGPVCVPPGASIGEVCTAPADCRSGICGEVCTTLCDTVRCPTGYECRAVGALMACYVPGYGQPAGGCAASPGHARGAAGLAMLGLALALVVARRRR